ncbi:leucine-rich repeat domain-containing protein [Fimbriiglobus ruber]|uniref:leucine-rich repeat domain-containing protein n=1 Tax=Fimbriiglobus ruber TaxID=1908690 RepID=UPI0013796346|nr:leucine-rich repeat domain-containing protein [Fimbriiglobus ruber]
MPYSKVIDLSPLSELTALTTLDLSETGVSDVGPLSELSALTTLNLYECRGVSDVGPLAELTALTTLDLSYTGVSDVGPLAELSALTTLNLSGCTGVSDVGPLAELTALTTLNLSWCTGVSDVGPLSELSALTTLNLSGCTGVSDVGPLSELSALTTLDLSETGVSDVGPLSELSALTTLDLSGCTGVSDVGPLSELTALTTLDLSRCTGVSDVGPLSELSALTTLNLSGCTGVSDVGPLSALTALTTLDLSGCTGVSDIGPLSELSALTTLNLSRCEGVSDVGPLSELTALTTLILSGCTDVSDVGPLSDLTALITLDLSWCTGVSDVGPLSELSALTTLDLSWCTGVSDVGPLSELSALTTLNLSRCEGVSDVGPLSELTALTTLNLSGCTGVSDVGPLSELTALTTLNLSRCEGVSDVGPLSALTALTTLDLSGCTGVSDIGPLSELTTLTTLDLSRCSNLYFGRIQKLLPRLNDLKLYQADCTDLPAAICGEESYENVLSAVRAYFDDLGADPKGDAELKVFLLGNGRVGKTKLARRLMGLDYGSDDEPSTHGVRLGTFPLEIDGLPHPIRLNLWDFGGQDIYLGSHALFLQGQAVFFLLWTHDHEQGREFEEGGFTIRDRPLAYWFDYLRGLAGIERDGRRRVESPVILVQSQCESKVDERPLPVEPAPDDFPNVYSLKYSARTNRGAGGLQDALTEAVGELYARRKQPLIGKGRAKVREQIRAMQAEPEATRKRTITRAEFDTLCEETGGISNTAEFLKFLHRSGVVFFRGGVFGDRVIIDQTWALDAVYTVFHRRAELQDAIGSARGRFTREKLDHYVWAPDRRAKNLPPYTIEEQRTFLGLMEQCGICFQVRQVSGQSQEHEYVAPELLPPWDEHRAIRFREMLKKPDATVSLRYDFLHDGVIRSFLSKLGDKVGEFGDYWKFGCWFYDKKTDSEVLIRAESSTDTTSGAGAIVLNARGPRARDLLQTLVEIVTQLPLGQAPRLDPSDFFDRTVRPTLPATPIPAKEPSPVDLLRPAFPRRTLFVSYRHGESRKYLDELIPVLETVTGNPARVVWDKNLRNDESISGFIESVRTIPVLVSLLGPSYLQSRYCLSELFGVYESSGCKLDPFRVRVLPLILDDAKIDDVIDRGRHAQHWSSKAKELGALAGDFHLADADYGMGKQMHDWGKWLGDALSTLADPLLPRGWPDIKADGFRKIRGVLEERFRKLGVD